MCQKRKSYYIIIGLLCFVLLLPLFSREEADGGTASKISNTRKIHPRNKKLIRQGLVPPSILKYFPDVPKITPYEALALYRANKAVFIAIGHDAPRLSNGWLLKDYMRFDPKRLKKYRIPLKGKLIVLYCG